MHRRGLPTRTGTGSGLVLRWTRTSPSGRKDLGRAARRAVGARKDQLRDVALGLGASVPPTLSPHTFQETPTNRQWQVAAAWSGGNSGDGDARSARWGSRARVTPARPRRCALLVRTADGSAVLALRTERPSPRKPRAQSPQNRSVWEAQ